MRALALHESRFEPIVVLLLREDAEVVRGGPVAVAVRVVLLEVDLAGDDVAVLTLLRVL